MPSSGIWFQPRVAAAGARVRLRAKVTHGVARSSTVSTRSWLSATSMPSGTGDSPRRLREGRCGSCSNRTVLTTMSCTGETTLGQEAGRAVLRRRRSGLGEHVVIDGRFLRPAEVRPVGRDPSRPREDPRMACATSTFARLVGDGRRGPGAGAESAGLEDVMIEPAIIHADPLGLLVAFGAGSAVVPVPCVLPPRPGLPVHGTRGFGR